MLLLATWKLKDKISQTCIQRSTLRQRRTDSIRQVTTYQSCQSRLSVLVHNDLCITVTIWLHIRRYGSQFVVLKCLTAFTDQL